MDVHLALCNADAMHVEALDRFVICSLFLLLVRVVEFYAFCRIAWIYPA